MKTMTDMDDQERALLDRLLSGDEQALAVLFSKHRERLWQMVHFRMDSRLTGRVDEDDILQEAYLDARSRLRHVEDHGPTTSFMWLRMIVAQTLVDVHRRHLGVHMRSVHREISIHATFNPQATSLSIAGLLLGHLTSPSYAAVRAELAGQLEQALATMDPLDQEVLALRHFEELTNGEVAEILGIQPKAASMRYMRALKRLRGIMEKVGELKAEP